MGLTDVDVLGWTHRLHTSPYLHIASHSYQIHIKPSKTSAAANKAPVCPTPAPTPAAGPGYTLYGPNQRVADGRFVGYAGGSGRRALVVHGSNPYASACQAMCSGAGFAPTFYLSLQKTDGACYCSQDK